MSNILIERETILTFNEHEDHAEVYTASKTIAEKLKKNPEYEFIEESGKVRNNTKGWFFKCSRKFAVGSITRKKRQVSEKQRKEFADRMKKMREEKMQQQDC